MKNENLPIPVYRHQKRGEWGPALLAWERGAKRGYLFEDGTVRVFAQPYYHLMKLHQVEQASLSRAFQQQISQMSLAKARGLTNPDREKNSVFSLDEQTQLLVGQFADGFAGEAWQKRHRGGGKSRLKRHRNPAIADAREVLAPERFKVALTKAQHEELWQNICEMLRATDLVPLREVKALEQRLSLVHQSLTDALAAMLHTEASEESSNSFGTHFSAFISELKRVLGRAPSWALATTLLALYRPDTHVGVHAGSLRQQSRWMGETTLHSKNPNAADYARANAFAQRLSKQLEHAGLAPADLLDVYDFVRTTTTASARERLEALRQSDLSDATEQSTNATTEEKSAHEREAA